MTKTNDVKPKVTIGVPVYNGEDYLEAALQAICDQTFVDYEVIISDNASTDTTAEICETFVSRDDRFRLIKQMENLGGAPNFNVVVGEAQGEYFKWATHDDLISPDYLDVCVQALNAAPMQVSLVYPPTILIDADGEETSAYNDGLDLRESAPSQRLRHYLRNYELSNSLHGMHRLDALRQTSLIGPYHSSDVILLAEIALAGEIWELDDAVFYRRWHLGMARLANASDAEFNAWFDRSKTVSHPMPRTRLFAEEARAVVRAPISVSEKAKSMWVLLSEWGPRYWRTVGGEFKREVYRAARVKKR